MKVPLNPNKQTNQMNANNGRECKGSEVLVHSVVRLM